MDGREKERVERGTLYLSVYWRVSVCVYVCVCARASVMFLRVGLCACMYLRAHSNVCVFVCVCVCVCVPKRKMDRESIIQWTISHFTHPVRHTHVNSNKVQ